MYVRKQTGLWAKARVNVVYHYHRFAAADAKPECSGSGGIWQINDACLAVERFRSVVFRLYTEESIQDLRRSVDLAAFLSVFPSIPDLSASVQGTGLCPERGYLPERLRYMDIPDAEQGMFFCCGHDVANIEIQVVSAGNSAAYDTLLHQVVFFPGRYTSDIYPPRQSKQGW